MFTQLELELAELSGVLDAEAHYARGARAAAPRESLLRTRHSGASAAQVRRLVGFWARSLGLLLRLSAQGDRSSSSSSSSSSRSSSSAPADEGGLAELVVGELRLAAAGACHRAQGGSGGGVAFCEQARGLSHMVAQLRRELAVDDETADALSRRHAALGDARRFAAQRAATAGVRASCVAAQRAALEARVRRNREWAARTADAAEHLGEELSGALARHEACRAGLKAATLEQGTMQSASGGLLEHVLALPGLARTHGAESAGELAAVLAMPEASVDEHPLDHRRRQLHGLQTWLTKTRHH